MINFDLEKMLFTIPAEEHGIEEVAKVLRAHPEVKFVSFAGVDLGGHFTDEKIPIKTSSMIWRSCLKTVFRPTDPA